MTNSYTIKPFINYHKRTNEKSLISLNEACMQRGVSLGLYLSIKREKAGEGGRGC